MTITETDRAWAAGFFDGEGTTVAGRGSIRTDGTYTLYVRCCLGQAEQQWPDLDRFIAIVGCGTVSPQRTHPKNHAPFRLWQAQSMADVATCQNILWPYLGSYKRLRWEQVVEQARASRIPSGAGARRTDTPPKE